MSEAMDLKKEKNLFETNVIESQNGGALSWTRPYQFARRASVDSHFQMNL